MKLRGLPLRHVLLAITVALVWGVNFVIIKMALADIPPLLFGALRFTLVILPAVFILKRPKVSWGNLAAYGLFIGAGQFGLLFVAMRADVSPGLASLLMQAQVFFTIALAVIFEKETLRPHQWAALLIALAGIALIGLNTGGSVTWKGLLLTQTAAFSWGCGNIVSKRAKDVNMLAYVVWSSLFAAPSLWVFAFVFEGWGAIESGLKHALWTSWAAVLWQTVGNSMFGYGVWGWLLSRYPASSVVPLALLIPVFGMAASALLLAEPMPFWKVAAAGLVLAGLALNLSGHKLSRYTVIALRTSGD